MHASDRELRIAREDLVELLAGTADDRPGRALHLGRNGNGWLASTSSSRGPASGCRLVIGLTPELPDTEDTWHLAVTDEGLIFSTMPGSRSPKPTVLSVCGPREDRYALMPASATTPHAHHRIEIPPRYGRVAGAMSAAAWRRLATLAVTIVGTSRTGSAMARLLVRAGVGQLTLVDQDVLEEHNVDSLGSEGQLGRSKALVLTDELSRTDPRTEISPLWKSADRLSVAHACDAGDIIVSCLDNAEARAIVSSYATGFLRTHLDIGTGVFLAAGSSRLAVGADVRLLSPGVGCLFCIGGLAGQDEQSGPFPGGRAGSDPGINHMAAGLGFRLLTAWLRGDTTSCWKRIDDDVIHDLEVSSRAWCRVCARRGGGLASVAAALDV